MWHSIHKRPHTERAKLTLISHICVFVNFMKTYNKYSIHSDVTKKKSYLRHASQFYSFFRRFASEMEKVEHDVIVHCNRHVVYENNHDIGYVKTWISINTCTPNKCENTCMVVFNQAQLSRAFVGKHLGDLTGYINYITIISKRYCPSCFCMLMSCRFYQPP